LPNTALSISRVTRFLIAAAVNSGDVQKKPS